MSSVREILRRAQSLLSAGRLGPAIELIRREMRGKPDHADACGFLAQCLFASGELEQSLYYIQRAVQLRPDVGLYWSLLAGMLNTGGRAAEAESAARRAVSIDPRTPGALLGLGVALMARREYDEASDRLMEAIAMNPRDHEARRNRARILADCGMADRAAAEMRAAMELAPNEAVVRGELAFYLNYSPAAGREEVFRAQVHAAELFESAHPVVRTPRAELNAERRLRAGFVSPDFRSHSVSFFAEPVLRHIDREAFDVVLYATHPGVDDTTRRLRGLGHAWRECAMRSDAELADLVRSDRIDILIDLAGWTAGTRPELFAMKPAPVQATWCGYPNTTGLRRMDWRLVDSVTDPPGESERFATERLARLDPCFLCYSAPADAPVPSRAPGDVLTFGSFNAAAKINDTLIGTWCRVLRSVPGSRLVLKNSGLGVRMVRQRISEAFEACGIGVERLELIGYVPDPEDHLRLYGTIDVALDTFPYHGTTTTCEALWMGVPVVTLEGMMHAGRVGVSLLSAVGLRELIARSEDGYVSLAASLARDSSRLCDYRRTLRERMASSALCDGAAFGARFGAVLREMWRDHCVTKT